MERQLATDILVGGSGLGGCAAALAAARLGALLPVRVDNLLPACKNIGTIRITNGAYRVHPVEWSIGEAGDARHRPDRWYPCGLRRDDGIGDDALDGHHS